MTLVDIKYRNWTVKQLRQEATSLRQDNATIRAALAKAVAERDALQIANGEIAQLLCEERTEIDARLAEAATTIRWYGTQLEIERNEHRIALEKRAISATTSDENPAR